MRPKVVDLVASNDLFVESNFSDSSSSEDVPEPS